MRHVTPYGPENDCDQCGHEFEKPRYAYTPRSMRPGAHAPGAVMQQGSTMGVANPVASTPGATMYRLRDGTEINLRQEPNAQSALTGTKVARLATFEVLESTDVAGGRQDGGTQTYLRLSSGGWLFLYHPKTGAQLADPLPGQQPVESNVDEL